jgi:hypothetical protein
LNSYRIGLIRLAEIKMRSVCSICGVTTYAYKILDGKSEVITCKTWNTWEDTIKMCLKETGCYTME